VASRVRVRLRAAAGILYAAASAFSVAAADQQGVDESRRVAVFGGCAGQQAWCLGGQADDGPG